MERNKHFWGTVHPVRRHKRHYPMSFCFTATLFSYFTNYWKSNWNQFWLGEAWASDNMFWNSILYSVLIIIYLIFVLNAMKFEIILRDPLVMSLRLWHRRVFLKWLHFSVCHTIIQNKRFITLMKVVQWRMHLANHNSGI